MSANNFICTVCEQPKNELTPCASELIPDLMLYRCGECTRGKKEPRWAIKLAAMTMGNDAVRKWVTHHRYVGPPITLSEVV